MTKLYTVARKDGENRQYNLTLREAAQIILRHDGRDYEIRAYPNPHPTLNRRIFWHLWHRHTHFGLIKSTISSFEQDYSAAEADIFNQVIKVSRKRNWIGLVVEEQDAYRRSLDAMRAEEDDPECVERIDAELAKMRDESREIVVAINERERDTVLAALRYWQREGLRSDGHERDIAEGGRTGDDAALLADEIDELCERINT